MKPEEKLRMEAEMFSIYSTNIKDYKPSKIKKPLTIQSLLEQVHHLEKENAKAKELLSFWVDDFYDAFNNSNSREKRHKALVETEQFLKEEPMSNNERTFSLPADILGLWEQAVCEIRSEIKAQDTPALVFAKELCDKLEYSMCAIAGGNYPLRFTIAD